MRDLDGRTAPVAASAGRQLAARVWVLVVVVLLVQGLAQAAAATLNGWP